MIKRLRIRHPAVRCQVTILGKSFKRVSIAKQYNLASANSGDALKLGSSCSFRFTLSLYHNCDSTTTRLRYDDITTHSTTTKLIEITTCVRFDCDTTTIRLRRKNDMPIFCSRRMEQTRGQTSAVIEKVDFQGFRTIRLRHLRKWG